MLRARWILLLLAIGGCDDNPCIEMCQQYERWLNTCDRTWEDQFYEEGWSSVDDCYDEHWGADEAQQAECEQEAGSWWDRPCS